MRCLLLFLFSHRFLAQARWESYFLSLRLKNVLGWQPRRIARFLRSREQPTFLNFGSGPRGLADPHWVNLDGFDSANVHYCVDFGRVLPLPNDTFQGVFCEHVIEHFSFADGLSVCRELLRCLRPGGCIRLIVPNAEIVMRQYFDSPEGLTTWRGTSGQTAMQVVNDYFRQRYEHHFLYDWETMRKMLLSAGFEDVRRCAFRQGFGPRELRIDDVKYERESLYVEATKAPARLVRRGITS